MTKTLSASEGRNMEYRWRTPQSSARPSYQRLAASTGARNCILTRARPSSTLRDRFRRSPGTISIAADLQESLGRGFDMYSHGTVNFEPPEKRAALLVGTYAPRAPTSSPVSSPLSSSTLLNYSTLGAHPDESSGSASQLPPFLCRSQIGRAHV